ncbi:PASTA domain-containing protein [Nocardia nova]|uniref:PASTA domain-containing protein n=1 Tax=Nocardia nova TaxID=37330 RepID=UPI0018729BC4|nr:PASTA domain-containing protein [Nocardia nova]
MALLLAPAMSACDSDDAPAPSTSAAPTAASATSAPPAASATAAPGATVTVPDVSGERPLAADQMLTGAGLRAHITGGTGRGPGGGQCVVTTQHPDAGASVAAGTTVELGTGEVGGSSPC